MPSALETVKDYIDDARVLLLDKTAPYRYDDPSLLVAFNVALMEAQRLRADLFMLHYNSQAPFFSQVDTTPFHFERPFRLGIVFGLLAHAIQRDQEDVQDARAATFMQGMHDILIGLRPTIIKGGSNQQSGAKA